MSPLSASNLFRKNPYPTLARLGFGFLSFVAVIIAILAGIAVNRSCAGVEWTHTLWIEDLKTIPQQLGILWFIWVPLGAITAMVFASLTKDLRHSALLMGIRFGALLAIVALIVAVLGTGSCWVPNF